MGRLEHLSDEELEIAVRIGLQPNQYECPDGPVCFHLLTRPEEILMDRSRWPNHLCSRLMETSCNEFAEHRTLEVFGIPFSWEWWGRGIAPFAGHIPISVGRHSTSEFLKYKGFNFDAEEFPYEPKDIAERFSVFLRSEKAILVLQTLIGTTKVSGFGLVEKDSSDEQFTVWQPVEMQFELTGDALATDVQAFCRNARSWWRSIGGLKVGAGGRPKLPITYELVAESYFEILQALEAEARSFSSGIGKRTPTDADICDNLEAVIGLRPDERTLRRRRDEWIKDGYSWPPIQDN
jgi:hypothetical protein